MMGADKDRPGAAIDGAGGLPANGARARTGLLVGAWLALAVLASCAGDGSSPAERPPRTTIDAPAVAALEAGPPCDADSPARDGSDGGALCGGAGCGAALC